MPIALSVISIFNWEEIELRRGQAGNISGNEHSVFQAVEGLQALAE